MRKTIIYLMCWLTALVGLYSIGLHNYLLFHSLVEVFSISIAFAIFMVAWNSSRFIANSYLLTIGVAYLFIGFLDLLHTLSYKGMGIFTGYDYYANQLWTATRYLESITLVVAFGALATSRRIRPGAVFLAYLAVTGGIVASIFWWKIFPVCFVEGLGLTPFKKTSEYIISAILVLGIISLYRFRDLFGAKIRTLIVLSMGCTIVAELSFTFYVSNYGLSNMVGHYFKAFSFYLIYRAIVTTGIKEPYTLIFSELKDKERELERQAATDGLTGVFNRRTAFSLLEKVLTHCRRSDQPATVCYIDLDNLKEVNDRYGHAAGDNVILAFCEAARRAIRESDTLCRLGGDEFLLILPQCGSAQAERIVGRIRELLAGRMQDETRPYAVEFSWGLAGYDGHGPIDADRLVELADSRMYRQKTFKKGKRADLAAPSEPPAGTPDDDSAELLSHA